MAKKRNRKGNVTKSKTHAGGWQPSYWMIVAAIFFFFSAGLVVKIVFTPVSGRDSGSRNNQSYSNNSGALESQVKLVAANFRCACGACGELFLVDCTCDMPKGAVEEKAFIRDKLLEGLTIDQIIQMVDQRYGHRII